MRSVRALLKHFKSELRDAHRQPVTLIVIVISTVSLLVTIGLYGTNPSQQQLLRMGGANFMSIVHPSQWWHLLASNFVHTGPLLYAVVMIGVWYMLSRVERTISYFWMSVVVVASGVISSVVGAYGVSQDTVQVGASGIVAGACAVGLVLDPRAQQRLGIMARWFLGSFVAYSLLDHGSSAAAHAGGFGAGLLVATMYTSVRTTSTQHHSIDSL